MTPAEGLPRNRRWWRRLLRKTPLERVVHRPMSRSDWLYGDARETRNSKNLAPAFETTPELLAASIPDGASVPCLTLFFFLSLFFFSFSPVTVYCEMILQISLLRNTVPLGHCRPHPPPPVPVPVECYKHRLLCPWPPQTGAASALAALRIVHLGGNPSSQREKTPYLRFS